MESDHATEGLNPSACRLPSRPCPTPVGKSYAVTNVMKKRGGSQVALDVAWCSAVLDGERPEDVESVS